MEVRIVDVRFLCTDLRRWPGAAFLVSRSDDEVGSDGRKGFNSSSRCWGVNSFPCSVPRWKAVACVGVTPVADAMAREFARCRVIKSRRYVWALKRNNKRKSLRKVRGAMRVNCAEGVRSSACIRKVNVDRLSSHVLWRLRCCRMGRPSASSWVLSPVETVPLRVWLRKCQERRGSCLVCFRIHVLE
jgi:hypothetical protein